MEQHELETLYRKHLNKELSEAEQSEFDRVLLAQGSDAQILSELIDGDWAGLQNNELLVVNSAIADRIFDAIVQKESRPNFSLVKIITGAAAVAALVFGVWFFNFKAESSNEFQVAADKDISPGSYGASITLADGRVIQLDSAKKGVRVGGGIKYVDGTEVRGQDSAQLFSTAQNLMASTSKSQTYELNLPDGTLVFLNADSKLEFPSRFDGNERRVRLTGEAYFKVKHDQRQPFLVESAGQVVEDIGTAFNVNSYSDEKAIKTTLVEGSASVTSSGKNPERKVLSPNQQAVLEGSSLAVRPVDAEEAIDWMSGKIIFENEQIGSIMKRVSRWYNVEVVYQDDVADLRFGGAVSRNKKISAVLNVLSQTGNVKIELEGRRVTISRIKK